MVPQRVAHGTKRAPPYLRACCLLPRAQQLAPGRPEDEGDVPLATTRYAAATPPLTSCRAAGSSARSSTCAARASPPRPPPARRPAARTDRPHAAPAPRAPSAFSRPRPRAADTFATPPPMAGKSFLQRAKLEELQARRAAQLPTCALSDAIEAELPKALKESGVKLARPVVVRVVSRKRLLFQAVKELKQRYGAGCARLPLTSNRPTGQSGHGLSSRRPTALLWSVCSPPPPRRPAVRRRARVSVPLPGHPRLPGDRGARRLPLRYVHAGV